MTCVCPTCDATLYIADSQLKGVRKPLLTCPECNKRILIQPSSSACGKCSHIMKYYPFQFDKESPIAKCPGCKTLNRLQL